MAPRRRRRLARRLREGTAPPPAMPETATRHRFGQLRITRKPNSFFGLKPPEARSRCKEATARCQLLPFGARRDCRSFGYQVQCSHDRVHPTLPGSCACQEILPIGGPEAASPLCFPGFARSARPSWLLAFAGSGGLRARQAPFAANKHSPSNRGRTLQLVRLRARRRARRLFPYMDRSLSRPPATCCCRFQEEPLQAASLRPWLPPK